MHLYCSLKFECNCSATICTPAHFMGMTGTSVQLSARLIYMWSAPIQKFSIQLPGCAQNCCHRVITTIYFWRQLLAALVPGMILVSSLPSSILDEHFVTVTFALVWCTTCPSHHPQLVFMACTKKSQGHQNFVSVSWQLARRHACAWFGDCFACKYGWTSHLMIHEFENDFVNKCLWNQ